MDDARRDSPERRWNEGREESRPPASARELVSGDAMHAWIECLLPGGNWCGFDPTNNLVTNAHYIKVHTGRDYGDALPVRGLYRGPAATTLEVGVRVVSDERPN